jgi:hypothetical protein
MAFEGVVNALELLSFLKLSLASRGQSSAVKRQQGWRVVLGSHAQALLVGS